MCVCVACVAESACVRVCLCAHTWCALDLFARVRLREDTESQHKFESNAMRVS